MFALEGRLRLKQAAEQGFAETGREFLGQPKRSVEGRQVAVAVRATNRAEGFFRHLRRYPGRFPGGVDPAHSEHALGCLMLACEQAHAGGDHCVSEHRSTPVQRRY
jgi:hypothetical protein